MTPAEAFRSIHDELLDHIQEKVAVHFDVLRQRPVSFRFRGTTHRVARVVGHFRTNRDHPLNAYLIADSEGELYFLYFQFCEMPPSPPHPKGFWVLGFRIWHDRELMALYRRDRKMLINMTFKRVVDFHGHACPDLVIGGKFCEYAHSLLAKAGTPDRSLSIVAENSTSALDAIQVLLGATMGNQRLRIMDHGKHVYTLIATGADLALRFALKPQTFDDAEEYQRLAVSMAKNRLDMDDVVKFQYLLDHRVAFLLSRKPEELYTVQPVAPFPSHAETASIYRQCAACGEQVLSSHAVEYDRKVYCTPCFQRLKTDSRRYRWH